MAVILQMTYSKKLGLPNFSSHQCSVSLQVEIADASQTAEESRRLYKLLQGSVDREIEQVGFLPDATVYGMNGAADSQNNGRQSRNGNGTSQQRTRSGSSSDWSCSDKQKELILKFVDEQKLDKGKIEDLAHEMFDKGVRELNRLEASGLIDEMFDRFGKKNGNRNRKPFNRTEYSRS